MATYDPLGPLAGINPLLGLVINPLVAALNGSVSISSNLALNGVLYGNASGPIQATAAGSSNMVLATTSSASPPAFSATPTVNSLTTASNLSVGGTGTVTGTLIGSSNATVAGTATVTGTIIGSSNETVAGTLGVTGTFTESSNATIGGTLGVTGTLTASSNATITGTITGSSNANITGILSVTSSAVVTGGISGLNLTVTSSAQIGTKTNSASTLTVAAGNIIGATGFLALQSNTADVRLGTPAFRFTAFNGSTWSIDPDTAPGGTNWTGNVSFITASPLAVNAGIVQSVSGQTSSQRKSYGMGSSGPGIYFGSSVPTITAVQGSLFFNVGGSSTTSLYCAMPNSGGASSSNWAPVSIL